MDFTIPSYVYVVIQKAYLFILCVCVMCGIYICMFMGGHSMLHHVCGGLRDSSESLLTFLPCFETGSLLLCKLGYLTFRTLSVLLSLEGHPGNIDTGAAMSSFVWGSELSSSVLSGRTEPHSQPCSCF